ncbi:MAG: hypothetical protein QOD42_2622 [Sphingomonadales bacterium]|jgi:hypothetical protein|nr:hypothetical protein [Sphingomonadales bacterium]
MNAPLNVYDIRYADVVVLGRIVDYRIVLDPIARRDRRNMLAHSPGMRVEERRRLRRQTSFLSDYARFDVMVDDVLVGRAGAMLIVTWDNSTFDEPRSMPPGPFLIALRDPGSRSPPLRGPSATILPNREPRSLTVLQAACSSPFIFESASNEAAAVRWILAQRPTQPNVR